MGLAFEEKTKRKIEDGKRVIFTLLADLDDFHEENDEGCYTCDISIFDKDNKVVDEYCRLFLVKSFNQTHYKRFINRFCNDIIYRESFNMKNEIHIERDKNAIDERISGLIIKLNELGLKTKYSCQGTDDEWSDRPCKKDGHSECAYISFVEPLPATILEKIKQDNRLRSERSSVYAGKRQYNKVFPDILAEIFLTDRI